MDKVFVEAIQEYDTGRIKEFVKNCFQELGIKIKRGDSVLVKPNFILVKPSSSPAITNPAVIKAVLEVLLEKGATPFIYEIPSVSSSQNAVKACGLDRFLAENHIEVKGAGDFEPVSLDGNMHIKKIPLPVELKKADLVISLAKLKTHSLMGLTMGVKNIFGFIKPEHRNQLHFRTGRDRAFFANMLIDIHRLARPNLTILDAVEGMEGNGPTNGTAKHFGFMAASKNAFAMDAAVIGMLKTDPALIPIQKEALARKIPGSDLKDVRIIGVVPKLDGIKLPDTYTHSSKNLLNSALSLSYPLLKKLFDSRPQINYNKCVGCFNCKNVCPAKAISNKNNRPLIGYSKCLRCFCCHEVCPHNAIQVHNTFLRKLLEKNIKRRMGS